MPAPRTSTISRIWASGDTLSPCCAASATSGPEMATASTAGISVTNGASTARKTSSSRPMMKMIDSSWIWLSVLPDLACWSTLMATAPARCTDRPEGGPSLAIVARRSLTRVVRPAPVPPWLTLDSTWSCAAWPSGERPRSRTLTTVFTWARSRWSLSNQAWSAGVSGPRASATTGTGRRLDPPSGFASCRACSLGALAGRNWRCCPGSRWTTTGGPVARRWPPPPRRRQ